ncbi:aminotransferase class I/II-fold pyridoxal phosphate-dependent enzyme [Sporosarcina cyprini]|uniref:aminotransferase class I/II-fold pyridoxal phosphate-dependent enzyme n=1 Tax=Sporosarcina cyprini TaxID=2910523 RepID=UPI001EDD272E|nr:aminotransferase class I/II-fold pyridoxal phosphate-dependent enzyme [Sporosarcina cyprini]MCG3086706.1 aminotransferase class I/II-fold pyridoxal phosphate-dependent enzyme [Sporosarcina cyprini]
MKCDMDRPVIQALDEFIKQQPISFHVPGHKNGLLSTLPKEIRTALSYDVTELSGLDDLHEPAGMIQDAERRLADLYQSDRSFFLVNGSTVGNLAMMFAVCSPGDTVIVQRNAHKSIFHAIELTGARPVFVSPEWDEKTQTIGTVRALQIKKAIEAAPDAKAVVLTYPTYYGITGNEMAAIIEQCHERRIPVLVDEAHGAHFVPGGAFPPSALSLGADVVVHSAHKTLPAMTMASFMHVRSSLIDAQRIAHYLKMLQSSSPSYLLMASLDDARSYAASYTSQDQEAFLQERSAFIHSLRELSSVDIVEVDDPLKLLLRVEGYTGFALLEKLEAEGIFAELADPFQVLFILPLLKKDNYFPFEESLVRIRKAITRLKSEAASNAAKPSAFTVGEEISTLAIPPTELSKLEAEWVPIDSAIERVAAGSIIPYPPGVPLVLGGERINEKHAEWLTQYIMMNAKFQGAIRTEQRKILVAIE